MRGDFGGVVVDEVPDAVGGDAAEFGPFAEGADRGFVALREDSAVAEAVDVRERVFFRGCDGCVHDLVCVSTHAADFGWI